MSVVRLLPETTSRRLAAGEVIVRPASVVKELIENALDAGAGRIAVELRDGGRNLIRVADDGSGMSRDDLRLAVHRHATSKLRDIDDLLRLRTYGFRGEALASIAAVSRLRIETCRESETVGTFLAIEAGEVKEIGDLARSRGTTVLVTTLFCNLPVRRGFLKSDSHEVRLALETVRQYALMYADVHVSLHANGSELLLLPKAGSIRDRLALFLDDEISGQMVELSVEHPMLGVRGYLLSPFHSGPAHPLQQVFINRRPVRNRVVVRAVYDGYGGTLRGGNPTFLIMIETAPENLDVNIHPTKQEVKFVDERFLFEFVSESVRNALGIRRSTETSPPALDFEPTLLAPGPEAQAFWQLHASYVFAQVQSGYCVIDQHAAHERILFEDLMKGTGEPSEQGLLFPITIELAPEEHAIYEELRAALAEMGIQTKPFSGRTIVVETLPAGSNMTRDEVRAVFIDLSRLDRKTGNLREELAKSIACHGSIKAGQRLSQTEMESLINRLFSCRNPFFCPHGRPAVIRISSDDLAKRFGRI